jgi:hypothetical protein
MTPEKETHPCRILSVLGPGRTMIENAAPAALANRNEVLNPPSSHYRRRFTTFVERRLADDVPVISPMG